MARAALLGHSTSSRVVNPALPQFPPETRFALVRQMLLLDPDGNLVPTHLTELVQIRRFNTIPAAASDPGRRQESEFRMSRRKLFDRQAGGLTVIGPHEKKYSVFMTHGIDPFEISRGHDVLEPYSPVLESCTNCHSGSGIYAVRAYTGASRFPELPGLFEANPTGQREAAVDRKGRQHDLGLLQGLWFR